MSVKKALSNEICLRYQSGDRKKKTEILNEFTATTGYNRKYALDLLNRAAKLKQPELFTVIDGETVIIKPEKKKRPSNRKGKSVYGLETVKCLTGIWQFFWYKCGKYLSPLIREQMPYLEASKEPDFHITPETKKKLLAISPPTIDRLLKAEKNALRGKGVSGSKLGGAALLKQIPVRTRYDDTERATPGYFQTDTVHHCGSSDSGEFNLTLTVTDIASGWSEFRALKNKAHLWTMKELQNIRGSLPFTMIELHSDNGSEFINHDILNWWKITETLCLTRSRPRHSNDNCFAEQKNNAFVRNYAGYARFDSEPELAALSEVYKYLCPLLNFFIPNKKLVSKTHAGSKTVKVYDTPKTPWRRLMESALLHENEKNKLSEMRKLYNPVHLQYCVHKAVSLLMTAHRSK